MRRPPAHSPDGRITTSCPTLRPLLAALDRSRSPSPRPRPAPPRVRPCFPAETMACSPELAAETMWNLESGHAASKKPSQVADCARRRPGKQYPTRLLLSRGNLVSVATSVFHLFTSVATIGRTRCLRETSTHARQLHRTRPGQPKPESTARPARPASCVRCRAGRPLGRSPSERSIPRDGRPHMSGPRGSWTPRVETSRISAMTKFGEVRQGYDQALETLPTYFVIST